MDITKSFGHYHFLAVSVQIPTALDNTLAEANTELSAAGPSLCSTTFFAKYCQG